MILLIGDYSSVHYELSKSLRAKGLKVVLISDGDSYKKISADIVIPPHKATKYRHLNTLISIIRLFGAFGVINFFRLKNQIEKLESPDIVQLINPVAIPSLGALGNIMLIRYLKRKSKILSLCALGDDLTWIEACLNGKYKYSPFDRFLKNKIKYFRIYTYSLKYLYSPLYRLLDAFATRESTVIIPGVIDYDLAYQCNKKKAPLIDLPVAESNFFEPTPTKYPIKIIHAWQIGKEHKKGNDLLDAVVQRYLAENGSELISYEKLSNLSYSDYLKKYQEADLILDQVYSYGCGVTGALGMAAGKVVFSGFESGDFVYGINATPNTEELYHRFCTIIESPKIIDDIKRNAFSQAKRIHCAAFVADKYVNTWSKHLQRAKP